MARKKSNATLSKKELTALEDKAERSSRVKPGEGRGLKEFLKRQSDASKKTPKPGTRRAKVQSRRIAEKNIPKRVRDMMTSEKQDAKNKGDSKLKSENRRGRGPSKSGVEQSIKSATDKAKSAVARTASRVGPLSKLGTGVGLLLVSEPLGGGVDAKDPSKAIKQTARGKKQVPAGEMGMPKPARGAERGRGDGNAEVAARRAKAQADAKKKETPSSSGGSGGGSRTVKSGDTLSAIAQRAGVTLKQLLAANPQIKDANKIRPGQKIKLPKATIKGTGKSIYAAKGGMAKANCGASMKPTQKSSRGIK